MNGHRDDKESSSSSTISYTTISSTVSTTDGTTSTTQKTDGNAASSMLTLSSQIVSNNVNLIQISRLHFSRWPPHFRLHDIEIQQWDKKVLK